MSTAAAVAELQRTIDARNDGLLLVAFLDWSEKPRVARRLRFSRGAVQQMQADLWWLIETIESANLN